MHISLAGMEPAEGVEEEVSDALEGEGGRTGSWVVLYG
mgnify:CR=1 FL=1